MRRRSKGRGMRGKAESEDPHLGSADVGRRCPTVFPQRISHSVTYRKAVIASLMDVYSHPANECLLAEEWRSSSVCKQPGLIRFSAFGSFSVCASVGEHRGSPAVIASQPATPACRRLSSAERVEKVSLGPGKGQQQTRPAEREEEREQSRSLRRTNLASVMKSRRAAGSALCTYMMTSAPCVFGGKRERLRGARVASFRGPAKGASQRRRSPTSAWKADAVIERRAALERRPKISQMVTGL